MAQQTAIFNEEQIDPRDIGTPDDWVPRHPDLIRLTGKHPFNCEAPLPLLLEQGFITPTSLHYVRNHGPVPKLSWDTHKIVIDGDVPNPLTLSMDDLASFPYLEFPVTFACAGNRRKEQNMIKKTIGFNWGPAGVSTAVWKGVPLRYILQLAGVKVDDNYKKTRYVCFDGADKLPNGVYGTSITLKWAMDEERDVMLAYEINGKRLTPDHGFPVRMIIPGIIGGRMIKWLNRITLSDKESDSWYHFHDNRVLPPNVDAELANKEKWWYIPKYIIYELNVNSAIAAPAHDEIIPFSRLTNNSEYTLKGYAYTGGGRKVTRVEITLDDGKYWFLADLYDPVEHNGRSWCWTFWSLTIPTHSFLRCKEFRVRAWDSAHNSQPEDPTWNVMGMMNNRQYRVKVHFITSGTDVSLKFEHPIQPGNNPGGWMAAQQPAVPAPAPKPAIKNESSSKVPTFTLEQVGKHKLESDCWIVVNKKVYDCTKFIPVHPGGATAIRINAGTDCSDEFNAIHSEKARKLLDKFYIGDLEDSKKSKL
ncbi:16968_t:CDS:1 [Funneliformis caledonium]|uniref:Nitrate reductase [NADPH] n=1 Tax=Funneliformis caledonium TaxID=1117310 RepID=A0A9N9EQ77_9GLOM|nr:16968_t:CDS:1 [Funneliformis caledonium]